MEVLFGVHPVTEAVRTRPTDLDHVTMQTGGSPRLAALADLCRASRIRVVSGSRDELARMTRTETHGGAVAFLRERRALTLEDLLAPPPHGNKHLLLALDGVEDPHNLGALLRTADGAGVSGVVLPERRAVGVTGTVAKAAAGATEHVRLAKVTNLVRSLEQVKRENIWIVGLDERGSQVYTDFDFTGNVCLVLGREGAGLHDLTKRTCDFLLSIPMLGAVPSLNVSVAGAVVLYEAARQRRLAAAPPPRDEPAAKAVQTSKGSRLLTQFLCSPNPLFQSRRYLERASARPNRHGVSSCCPAPPRCFWPAPGQPRTRKQLHRPHRAAADRCPGRPPGHGVV